MSIFTIFSCTGSAILFGVTGWRIVKEEAGYWLSEGNLGGAAIMAFVGLLCFVGLISALLPLKVFLPIGLIVVLIAWAAKK
ncbi:hypothetical protein [Tumebacillus permanentifrigoris]|uniref:hypothetical protein n=1 Tax=Tumebacillus permanentifrigoris TaxID=378543 RepID=UPI0011B1F37B|nr:hypothetical protein [Tumebacillus permanentifrigoris]